MTDSESPPPPDKVSEALQTKWFKRLSRYTLVASVPAYFVFLFLNRELDFLTVVEVPLLSAAVLVMFLTLDHVQRKVDLMNSKIDRVHRALDDARLEIGTRLPGEVRIYTDHTSFYEALTAAGSTAKRTVWASYFRRYPPTRLGTASARYFDSCRTWAAADEQHRFRRLVVEPETPELEGWLVEDECQALRPNYNVRVVPWKLHDADSLSIAVIDEMWVFVAFSGEEDRLHGYSFHNPELIVGYVDYYKRIWESSTPLSEYLERKKAAAPAPEGTGSS